jgi:hypothetical protein
VFEVLGVPEVVLGGERHDETAVDESQFRGDGFSKVP